MATTLQFRRGTTAELAAITGAEAELFVDTDKGTVVVMDGATAGGIPLATEDYVDTALANVSLTGYATEAYVGTAISNVIDAAPAALDTLNELAAALGDDANYATTITNALAAKANTSSLATVATSGSYNDLNNKPTIPSLTGYATESYVTTAVSTKQDTLVSGTNIKTINGENLLGSGDITISGGGGGVTTGKAIAMAIVFG